MGAESGTMHGKALEHRARSPPAPLLDRACCPTPSFAPTTPACFQLALAAATGGTAHIPPLPAPTWVRAVSCSAPALARRSSRPSRSSSTHSCSQISTAACSTPHAAGDRKGLKSSSSCGRHAARTRSRRPGEGASPATCSRRKLVPGGPTDAGMLDRLCRRYSSTFWRRQRVEACGRGGMWVRQDLCFWDRNVGGSWAHLDSRRVRPRPHCTSNTSKQVPAHGAGVT